MPWSSCIYLNPKARRWRQLCGRRGLTVSELAVTEVTSALVRRRREGLLDADLVARLHRAILAKIESGEFLSRSLTAEVHREAERLLLLLSSPPLRAADALHLALALAAGARTILTFDRRLTEAARQLGLNCPMPGAPV